MRNSDRTRIRRTVVPVLFALLAATSLAYGQGLVGQYNLPSEAYFNSGYGLTSDGTHIYLSSSSSTSPVAGYIYKFDNQGNQVGSIATGLGPSQGLAWDGTHFWYFFRGSSSTSGFFRVTTDGAVVDTILTGTSYVGGCHWDGTGLWYSLYFPDAEAGFYKLDVSTGTVVDSFLTLGLHAQPQSITDDGSLLYWSGDDFSGDPNSLFIYDLAVRDTVGQIPLVDPVSGNARGVAWDGSNLWLLADPVGTVARALFKYDLGGGGQPNIDLPITDIDFGLVEIGITADRQLNVFNIGTAALVIDTLTFSDPAFFSDAVFPIQIDPGSSAALSVSFAPSDAGLLNGTMTIASNDTLDPQVTVTLSGTGLFAGPAIALTDTIHDYGDVWIPNGRTGWTVGIVNRGSQSLSITGFTSSDAAFEVEQPQVMLNIPPDDTASVRIWFGPTDAVAYSGSIDIASTDPLKAVVSIDLTGQGQAGPFALGHEFWAYQVPDNPNTSFNEYRPLALKPIADVNDDGVADVVISTGNYWTICLNGASDGFADELWRFTSYIANYSAGDIGNTNDLPPQQRAMAIANDLNGDGREDVVIGTGGGNEHVYALSGFDGTIIWDFGTDHPDSFSLGDFTGVWVDEDFNDDGIDDVVACASATASGGIEGRRTVYCFDGTNGTILWRYFVGAFTRAVVTAGDLNGNGATDVVVTTGDGIGNSYGVVAIESQGPGGPTPIWSYTIGEVDGGGREVKPYPVPGETDDVLVGAFFDRIFRIDGETGIPVWEADFGFSAVTELNTIPDLTGDGLPEVLVCSFLSNFYCLDGADGSVIWAKSIGNFSYSAVSIPDVSGDGISDVVLAGRNDVLYVLDGPTGNTLHQRPFNSGALQGATLANYMPDIDGNNSVEIIGTSDAGQLVALSGGLDVMVGVPGGDDVVLPAAFSLGQNFPNPFNPVTHIPFALPERTAVTLTVHDVLGREVARLIDGIPYAAGEHVLRVDGQRFASGVYFYRLEAGGVTLSRKMMLLK